jgi:hypothetical protein
VNDKSLQVRADRRGHAIGGRMVGRFRARRAMRCQCCRCRIERGDLVVEVLTAVGVLEVCTVCVGQR